jgi:glycosyltransferase involved in cell wall biosynthesis
MKKKVGVLVGEGGNWRFFDDTFAYLGRYYETRVYIDKVYATPLLYGRLNRWAMRHRIRSLLRGTDLCFFEWASELLAAATQMPKSCPIVTRLHAFELAAWSSRINWDRVDKVIVVSEAMARRFAARYPHCADKLRVVHNGVSLQRFNPSGRKRSGLELGMLCAIVPVKRVYEAILMLDGLRREDGLAARLHIGGGWSGDWQSEEYYEVLRRLTRRLGLDEDVVFHGYVSDTPRWFRNIDVFISNAYREGQQVALVEAMAAGCCCFSHTWDGAEEVLPGECLYTSEAELRTRITAYARLSEEEQGRCGARMRAIAEARFGIETTNTKIRAVIDEALAERESGR